MEMIRLLLVEGDIVWQKKINQFLNKQKNIVITGTACSKDEAVKFAKEFEVDVILVGIHLSKDDFKGIDTAYQIKKFSHKKIVMMGTMQIEEIIAKAFHAGIDYFIEQSEYKDLPFVLRMVTNCKFPFGIVLKEYHQLKKEEQLQILTQAEKEIFRLAEQGYSRTEMMNRAHISINTVKKHIKQILSKLEVNNMKEAILKVERRAII